MPHAAPSRAWEKVDSDIFTHKGQDYLITVDYLLNYFEVDCLQSKNNNNNDRLTAFDPGQPG